MSKIIFFGDKAIGHGILEYLKTTDEVIGVYTNPHKEKTTWFPLIKKIKTKKKPDWIVCAYYDEILPDEIISQAKCGAINIHMGLIQDYRGCYPTTLPIIDGKKEAGVTIHKMTSKIDGGEVYAQAKVSVDEYDTGKTLYFKCTGAGVALFKKIWLKIRNGELKSHQMGISKKYNDRSTFPSLEIDLKWPKDKIDRHVRALTFSPFEAPFFVINGKKFKIIYE